MSGKNDKVKKAICGYGFIFIILENNLEIDNE